ncbi:MAG: hypothetical protein QGH13_06955, partial [Candidatus Thalassarchaeaceae archaeon]|nr:hypothetical protein [Candidatus Thalassarchaeaceae archaeon]
MIRNSRFSLFFIIFILLAPVEISTFVSASNVPPATSISISGANYVEPNQSTAYTNSSISINFSVSIPNGSFLNGQYWYSGILNGSGNYSNGTILNLSSLNSGIIILNYRAQSTVANESNNTLTVRFDQSAPTPEVSALVSSYVENPNHSSSLRIVRSSSNGSIVLRCLDSSNVNLTLRLMYQSNGTEIINNSAYTNSLGSLSVVYNSGNSSHAPNSPEILVFECKDRAGNSDNLTLNYSIDTLPPPLTFTQSSPLVQGQCAPSSWYIWAWSNSSSSLEYSLNNSNWVTMSNPFTPNLNFSGELSIRALDRVGNENISNFSIIGFDQTPPSVNISTTNNSHFVSYSDDCSVNPSALYRWESLNGTTTSWTPLSNNQTVSPSQSYISSGYRLEVKVVDNSSRITYAYSNWSLVSTILVATGVHSGNWIGSSASWTATPPTNGWFRTTTQHSTEGQLGSHSSNQTATDSWSQSNLTSGTLWVNVTTGDSFGRTIVDVYTYTI